MVEEKEDEEEQEVDVEEVQAEEEAAMRADGEALEGQAEKCFALERMASADLDTLVRAARMGHEMLHN